MSLPSDERMTKEPDDKDSKEHWSAGQLQYVLPGPTGHNLNMETERCIH